MTLKVPLRKFGDVAPNTNLASALSTRSDSANARAYLAANHPWVLTTTRRIIGIGGSRLAVAWNSGYVLKVPHCYHGVRHNEIEAIYYENWIRTPAKLRSSDIVPARCKLRADKTLRMVVVTPLPRTRQPPDWARVVDSGQVGLH